MKTLLNNRNDRINLRDLGSLGIAMVVLLSAGLPATSVAESLKSFCEFGSATALQIGAGGAVWEQTWGEEPWEWADCAAEPNVGFLNKNVTGLQATTTSGMPVIDANLVLFLPFQGTITLTAHANQNPAKIAGEIKGQMTGTFVADLNAAHAVIGPDTIIIQFGQSVHSAPDALIAVTETTGKFKSIQAEGNWEWRVSGTITIARVPSLAPQLNILAALQNPALLLGAQEEVMLSGTYTRSSPASVKSTLERQGPAVGLRGPTTQAKPLW